MNIKGKFFVQHRILIFAEHKRNGSSHKSQRKQCRQRSHGKLHGAYFGGKLPQQKQVLTFVNTVSPAPDIADNPRRNTDIKQIDCEHQQHQKDKGFPRTGKMAEPAPEHQNKCHGRRKKNFLKLLVPFPDFLILTLCIHQSLNAHFSELPPAPKQGNQIAAPVAQSRHQNRSPMKTYVQTIIHSYHGKHYRHQNLLQQYAENDAAKKGNTPKKHIFPHIKSGNHFLFHSQKQVNAELPASFFQHEPHHIMYQPRHNQYDEKGGKPYHHFHHAFRFKMLVQFILKYQAVESIHERRYHRHGQHINRVIPHGTLHIAETEFSQHGITHLPSETEHPEFSAEKFFPFSPLLQAHGKSSRPLKIKFCRNNWRKKRRG